MWILLGTEHAKYDVHWAFLGLWKQSKGGAVCSQGLGARGVAPLLGVTRPWKHPDTWEGVPWGKNPSAPTSRQSCSTKAVTAQPQRLSRTCPKGNPSGELPAAAGWHTQTDVGLQPQLESSEGPGSTAAPLPQPAFATPAACRSFSELLLSIYLQMAHSLVPPVSKRT